MPFSALLIYIASSSLELLRASFGMTLRAGQKLSSEEIDAIKKDPLPREYTDNFNINSRDFLLIQEGSFGEDTCITGESDLQAVMEEDPIYTWYGPNGKEVDDQFFKTYDNGVVEIVKPGWWHTGFYVCQVTSRSDIHVDARFGRFYAIISNPHYSNFIYLYFFHTDCRDTAKVRLLDMLQITFCRGEPTCCYKVRAGSCLWNEERGKFESRVTIVQSVPELIYRDMPLRCGVVCKHTKSIEAMDAQSKPRIEKMLNQLNTLYSQDDSELIFWDYEIELRTICPEGFETKDSAYCQPCARGYHEDNHTDVCLICGIFSYQNLIAQKECKSCDWFKVTATYGAQEEEECIWFWQDIWTMLVVVPIVILLTVLPLLLLYCLCCCLCSTICNFILLCCICNIIKSILKPKTEIDVRNQMGRVDPEGNEERRKLLLPDTSNSYKPDRTMLMNSRAFGEEYKKMKHVAQPFETRMSPAFLSRHWLRQYSNTDNSNITSVTTATNEWNI